MLEQYSPTPEEIEEACKEIQAGWSEKERKSRERKVITRIPWQVPEVGEIHEQTTDSGNIGEARWTANW